MLERVNFSVQSCECEMESLLSKDEFIGIANVAHLAAGGESPILRSHLDALGRFLCDKGDGMPARGRMFDAARRAKEALARLLGGRDKEIALLANASEGLFVAASGIDWHPEDNVVVERVEYASVRYAWQNVSVPVQIRTVGDSPMASLSEIRDAANARTRVIAVSHVSYLTGAKHNLEAVREIADAVGARLVVDASHALGIIPVEGSLCDAIVSCAYKFLLGVHGVGIFYVNSKRWPDLKPPWVGWHSTIQADWQKRSRKKYELKADAERFEIGNLSFINVYVLLNALGYLERIGTPKIEQHVLALGEELWHGLCALDLPIITPKDSSARAGNVCFATDHPERLEELLRQSGVLVWGSEGRIRMSLHVYNDSADIARALKELGKIVK